MVNDSLDSVKKSVAIDLVNVATPVVEPVLTILNDPVREPSEKSPVSTLAPPVEKYSVVPAPTSVVLTVKLTELPSLTVVADGVTEYDGIFPDCKRAPPRPLMVKNLSPRVNPSLRL